MLNIYVSVLSTTPLGVCIISCCAPVSKVTRLSTFATADHIDMFAFLYQVLPRCISVVSFEMCIACHLKLHVSHVAATVIATYVLKAFLRLVLFLYWLALAVDLQCCVGLLA